MANEPPHEVEGAHQPSAPPAAPAAKKWNRQQPPPRLVGDFQLDVARIPQLIPEFLDGRKRFRAGGFDVGKLDSLLVLIHVVAVSDVEEVAGHGIQLLAGG